MSAWLILTIMKMALKTDMDVEFCGEFEEEEPDLL